MATPWHSGIMKDAISLKDLIMRDDMRKEKEAERICDVWEEVQSKYMQQSVSFILLTVYTFLFTSLSLSSLFSYLPLPPSLSLSPLPLSSPSLPPSLPPSLLPALACPAPAALDLSAGLANLLSVKLTCTTQFTNVLTVKVELNCKQTTIDPSLTLDGESLVHIHVLYCCIT